MSGNLRFDLKLKEHPYPEDSGSHLEAWCEINLLLEQTSEEVQLTAFEWDIVPLAEWFSDFQKTLLSESFSITDPITNKKCTAKPSESLASAIDRLKQRDFPDDKKDEEFQWSSQIYDFYQRHCLRFAFSGSKIDPIIIGLNSDDGEISLSYQDNDWAYYFDMVQFCEDLRITLVTILNKWLNDVDDTKFATQLVATIQGLKRC